MRKLLSLFYVVAFSITLLTSCKKENIVNQNEPKDYITTNMKMNYYGEILEYTVKYSPATNTRKVEGKDRTKAQKIVDSYPNSVTVFDSKNEVHFFRNRPDYYYYISTLNSTSNTSKINNTNNIKNNIIQTPTQHTAFAFYKDSYSTNDIISDFINTTSTPTQSFTLRQPCNDGSDNSCPTYSMNYIGKRVAWVGNDNNDVISSIRLRNFYSNGYAGVVTITLFQDIDFGGKAIAIYFPQYIYTYDQTVDQLSIYKINSLLKTWNDRTSSYECFYPF